mgnify:CR=1 FL=1
MGVLDTVVLAMWVMLPAYLPNNVAVIAGGGRPIDGGRTWHGRRVLGDGKTWRGSLAGVIGGVIVALGLNQLHTVAVPTIGVDVPRFSLPIVLAFPLGAVSGDIAASFLKRRVDRERGAALPGVDQLDFLVAALLVGALLDFAWMRQTFSLALLATVFILTPILHVGTNVLAYLLGLKDVPW